MTTLIGVGTRLGIVAFDALHVDGRRAQPTRVRLRFDDAGQRLTSDSGLRWPFADLRALRDQADPARVILRLAGNGTERLMLSDPEAIRLIRTRAPDLWKRPPVPGLWRLWAWAGAAMASVALIIFVLIPVMADQLARFIPPRGERALGEATFQQVRRALDQRGVGGLRVCTRPEGRAALDNLVARLTDEADLPAELTVHVLDSELVNAFALPGGIVVLFDGLIDAAGTPEEVAAVLAHEIGHVAARDPTRIALRSAGSIGVLGLLLGDFAGGAVVLFLANQVIQADYSRQAEAAADAYAGDLLVEAGLPPSAIADFFQRLQARGGEPAGLLVHLRSHPALGDRIAAARDRDPGSAALPPALTEAQWQALRSICP